MIDQTIRIVSSVANFKRWLFCSVILLTGAFSASAFTTNDANTVFTAYNNAFLVGGYYSGWWTGAEEIEMAEDAYDNSPTVARKTIVANACSQFVSHHGSSWFVKGASNYNEYNDDISWACIAFARGYLITGNTAFRNIAKANWDGMYNRAWDTNYFGGGLFWRQSDKQSKNAAVEGPAMIAACYLYNIYGDSSYLTKARAIYAWERQWLFQPSTGAIYDAISTNGTYNTWASTYNQGTFIGAANLLYRATGLPFYYQDAILVGKYTQKSMSSSAGILPQYGSASDLSGFNGIFCRWMGYFARNQNLWPTFGPWLGTNANAAWSVRDANNLCWQKWATSVGTNVPDSWGASAAVVVMQVADPGPLDALQTFPTAGFTAVAQLGESPNPTSIDLVLTNTGAAALNWSLASTSVWLNVSSSSGTLSAAGAANITVSLIPSATTNLPSGRYFATIGITNLASGVIASRIFTLAISGGNAPIAMTGYNAGVLAPNTATVGTPNATAFDIPNSYCFSQAGLNGATRGLPPDGVFTSQADATTVFQFMPYGSTNALVLGYNYTSSASLTLVTPQAYNSLVILASSANGNANGGTGTFILNFTNGTQSQVLNFNAPDWFVTTTNVAISALGRLKLGGSFGSQDNGPSAPNMYQTTLNLAALGLNQPISSITFTKPANAGSQQDCGIFAISGALAVISAVPTGLSVAYPGLNQVALSWNASAWATSYNVKRSTTSGSETTITNVSNTSYTDTNVNSGTLYYYAVSGVNVGSESVNSSEVIAAPLGNFTLNYGGVPIVEGIGSDWNNANVWTPGGLPASTSASADPGSTYEVVVGSRLRTPVSGTVTFPGTGTALVIDGDGGYENNTLVNVGELRIKHNGFNPTTNYYANLVLNGGEVLNGDAGHLVLQGHLSIQASSVFYIDSTTDSRSAQIDAWLTGSGNLFWHDNAFTNSLANSLGITGPTNTFNGQWIVDQGALLGAGINSLGTNNIIVGATDEAAAVETLYDLKSPNSSLTLGVNGKAYLHQNDHFASVIINGTPLTNGIYTFAQLNSAYPANFPANWPQLVGSSISTGSGQLVVGNAPPSIPHIADIGVSGTTLSLSVTNGTPDGSWILLQSTNVALPLDQWQTNTTGTFDGSGNLSTNILNTATNPQDFYILKVQ